MSTLPEFVGTIHIFLGPHRGNPIALYLRQEGESCQISPIIYPWNKLVGIGETANKAAADFDLKWKEGNLAPETYSGPHWEGGIKPEKPKPAPKPVEVKPTVAEAANLVQNAEAQTEAASPAQVSVPPETASTTNPSSSDQSTDKPTI